MSRDFSAAKTRLLELQQEYQTRIDKIEDHIYNPQDDLNEHWDDQAISMRDNEMRKTLGGGSKSRLTLDISMIDVKES
ncbi:hypothetical protein LK453_11950 [Psychrobacter sanguinis]|nr:hypothetical protein [Psychrobacter sanguinis]UEC25225.1 hypothetical protein LK453_11950 [Psychrobacter sanguinis]